MYKKSPYNCIIFLIIILLSDFVSYIYLKDYIRYAHAFAIVWMFVLLIINISKSHTEEKLYFRKYVFLFMFFPWISVIPAYFSHGQLFFESASVLYAVTLSFLLYFVLHTYNITEKQLFKVLILFSCVYVSIELLQQITFPKYWFAGREEIEERLGLNKFYITGLHILILTAFMTWGMVLMSTGRKKMLYLFLFIFFVIGIYVFLARKTIFSFLFCILLSFFITRKIKWYYWLLALTTAMILYFNMDVIFGDFIENTISDLSDNDFIRYQSFKFYINYFDDSLCLFLGNCRDYSNSGYGQFIALMQSKYNFYRADIGMFAHFSFYGIVGCIPSLLFVICLIKRWTIMPPYIKLYFIYNAIQLAIAFPLNSVIGVLTFSIALYLMDINIALSEKLKHVKKNSYTNYRKEATTILK